MYRIAQILFFFLFFSCSGNAQSETIYLLFEDKKSINCNISPYRDGRNKKETITHTKKSTLYKKNIVFKICYQFFVFNPNTNSKKIRTTKPKDIVNINYLTNKLEENYLDTTKEKLFKKIYILEKMNDGSYVQYEVLWKDMYVNDDE